MNLLNNDNFVTDKVKSIMNMKEEMIILENDVNMVKNFLGNRLHETYINTYRDDIRIIYA